MRTKHVLMTTALMALFAACTNDEFISNKQGIQSGDAALRPSVDVTLNVLGDGDADTRLTYNGKYNFEDGKDVIGALLMDKLVGTDRPFNDLEEWEEKPWLTRYELVDYINTDYPFKRNNGQWSTDAKMLEGNYFFAFPFASYEGYREAVHSIGEQVQHGQDINKAYAENQFFIGYSRIHAGTQGEEVMNASLELVPVLGTVGIQVKNVGTGEMTVKKIVLATNVESANRAKGLSTLIKIDPTDAMYKGSIDGAEKAEGYILDNDELTWADKTGQEYFNYANYEEMQNVNGEWQYIDKFNERYEVGGDLVNNTEKSANYNRREALRAVVKGIASSDQRAELTIEDSPVLKSQEYANFAIMTNIYEYEDFGGGKDNAIYAYVYTDKGMVGPVSLYDVKTEVAANPTVNGLTVISNNPLVKINPNHKITVALSVDNNSVQGPQTMAIYNEEDLTQFIEWNKNLKRVNTAELMNDITLTKEMSDMLTNAAWGDCTFIIKSEADKKLKIAADAAKDILDYVIADCDVEVLGDLVLGTNSFVQGTYDTSDNDGTKSYTADKQKLTIAEGVSVTVSSAIEYKSTGAKKNQALVVAENEGTLTIDKNVDKLTVTENKGEMNVNAIASLNGTSANKPNAVINISAAGQLNCGTTGYLTNAGQKLGNDEIEYAVINNNGKIFNLVNEEYGKVIVGEAKSVLTNVNSNDGIIDVTANIESELNKREGTISFTVAEGKSVTMANVAKYEISELIVDGGDVTSATATDAAAATPKLAKVVVTKNGGTIGGDAASALTNAAAEIEINGDVTLENLTIATTEDIEVKNGTTTINGTVDASSAKVVLGSYEDYKVQTGKLFIPTKDDVLKASSINKVADDKVKKENAQVNNNGKVELATAPNKTYVTWDGNNYTPKGTVTTPTNVTVGTGTYPTLDDLKTAIAGGLNVGTITISGTVAVDKDNYTVLKDKDIVLAGTLSGLSNDYIVDVNSLTAGANAKLEGEAARPGLVVMTAKKIDYSTNDLEISNGRLQYAGSDAATVGGAAKDIKVGETLTGTIESSNGLEWDSTNNRWKNFD